MSQICDKYVTTYQMITAVVCDGMRMVLYYKPIIVYYRQSVCITKYMLCITTYSLCITK